MAPIEADPFGAKKPAPVSLAGAPAMALSSQPKEVAEEVARAAQLRRVDKDLEHLMRARYPLIYILSSEEKRVEESIRRVLQSRERDKGVKAKVYTWSVTEGVRLGSEAQGDSKDPLKALRFVLEAKKDERAVFILRDLHAFTKNPELVRLLRDVGRNLKETLKTVFLISPVLIIPPECDKEIAVVEYPLPELAEIGTILDRVLSMVPNKAPPGGQEREHVIEAALGLTADEAENVFAKSLVQTGTFDIDVILSEKERIVRKSGVLEFFRTHEKMEDIGGLDQLKTWLKKRQSAFSEEARKFGLPRPKGILMIGIPGGGKSLTAKAVGASWRLPVLPPDVRQAVAGRFDEIFFVDLPTLPERREIGAIHVKRRGRDPSQFDLDRIAEKSEGFTGAEIEQAIVSALFDEYDRHGSAGVLTTDGVLHSISETVPLSRTMKEKVAALRTWCRTRARPASSDYHREEQAGSRKLDLDAAGGKAP